MNDKITKAIRSIPDSIDLHMLLEGMLIHRECEDEEYEEIVEGVEHFLLTADPTNTHEGYQRFKNALVVIAYSMEPEKRDRIIEFVARVGKGESPGLDWS